jgi:hypothetical protein
LYVIKYNEELQDKHKLEKELPSREKMMRKEREEMYSKLGDELGPKPVATEK